MLVFVCPPSSLSGQSPCLRPGLLLFIIGFFVIRWASWQKWWFLLHFLVQVKLVNSKKQRFWRVLTPSRTWIILFWKKQDYLCMTSQQVFGTSNAREHSSNNCGSASINLGGEAPFLAAGIFVGQSHSLNWKTLENLMKQNRIVV